jgi:choline-sulfatase
MTHAPANVVLIVADQLRRDALGCFGSPIVKTPNLDRLAARGTRFSNAYTASPICVPARASLATGRYVHRTRCWSSAEPYDGSIAGWAHVLRDAGRRVVSVGKLHFRSTEDDNGFTEELLPVHVLDGVGFPYVMLRKDPVLSGACEDYAVTIGRGESNYSQFDRGVARTACDWLQRAAATSGAGPWALFVSFCCPHDPLIAPAEFLDLYAPDQINLPLSYGAGERPTHPCVRAINQAMNFDAFFADPDHVRRARAAYYGLCSFVDHNVGLILAQLDARGILDATTVIFASDHGDLLGDHGLWQKSYMYEASAGVPLIAAGPAFTRSHVVETPASLIDIHPTMIAASLGAAPAFEPDCPGVALQVQAKAADRDRAILSEYHDYGSVTGTFMLRWRQWKYIHHVGYAPELFDIAQDPGETTDVSEVPGHATTLRACEAQLREIVDPEQANSEAFADQRRRIEALGGEDAVRNWPELARTPMPEVSPRD